MSKSPEATSFQEFQPSLEQLALINKLMAEKQKFASLSVDEALAIPAEPLEDKYPEGEEPARSY